MVKKRIEYLDIVRGIGILYMIFGHITYYEKFDHYIHAFHMPLFFFISGFFFHHYENLSWKEFMLKITKKLLVPYFLLGLLYSIIDGVFFNGIYIIPKNIITLFTINNNNFPIAGAFWYFTCAYFSSMIFFGLRKNIKNEYLLCFISFFIMIVGIFFKRIIDIELYLSFIPAMVSVGFIELGYLTKKLKLLEKYSIDNYIILIFIFIINLWCIMRTGYVNMRINVYPNVMLLLFNFVLAMIFYINISKKMEELSFLKPLLRVIKEIGKYSIIYLIMNQFIILLIKTIAFQLFLLNSNSLLYSIIVFLITVIINYLVAVIIRKLRFKFIFGL